MIKSRWNHLLFIILMRTTLFLVLIAHDLACKVWLNIIYAVNIIAEDNITCP